MDTCDIAAIAIDTTRQNPDMRWNMCLSKDIEDIACEATGTSESLAQISRV